MRSDRCETTQLQCLSLLLATSNHVGTTAISAAQLINMISTLCCYNAAEMIIHIAAKSYPFISLLLIRASSPGIIRAGPPQEANNIQ